MNKWSDAEAKNYIYLSYRSLVLHGGGNTSVKIKVTNKVKEQVEVIAVKGSGWDLSNIGTMKRCP